jgi:DNA polymerase-1
VSRKRLFLIDGMSHIYRAFYAIRNLSNSRGLPTNAIFGFTTMLRKLIQDEKPDFIGVAIDLEGPTVRHEKFESYKATRKPMPEELVQQLPYIRRVCEVFRVPVIGYPGYEADDVIGTLSRQAVARDLAAIIVTSDKDMLQLVTDRVLVMDPMKDNLLMDAQKVVEKMGVKPEQVPDLLGLWGDSVDNIPGAPGIGEKGAKELIQTYGTLENCLQNWDKVKRKTYQESLHNNTDLIRMSLELATIRQDLPIGLDLDSLVISEPDRTAAFELFAELEFKGLMREFLEERSSPQSKAEWLTGGAATEFLQNLRASGRITFALQYQDAPLGRKTAEAACVFGESGPPGIIDLKDAAIAREWDRLMRDPSLPRACWDAKLCRLAQESRRICMDSQIDDVMLMAFLTAPHIGDYSLRRWALEQLHVSLPEEHLDRAALEGLTRETVADGLFRELDAVRRLFEILNPRIDEYGLRALYREIELPLIPVLADMERSGIKVDPGTLRSLSEEMEKQLAELTTKIYRSAGVAFNINSPKQLGEILFEKLNLPSGKKTRKTGGYSTDQAVLEELAVSHEIPRLILEYRQIAKLKSTYVDALPGLINPATGRVHTSFNQAGAATGRLSSSDPNLQNIPVRTDLGRLIRRAFIPEKGNLLLAADYSQIELRVLAHLSQDLVLTDAFLQDQDIHERTALEVFGEAARSDRAEYRRRAKVINFGIVYGLSAFGLAQRLGIGREEAQAFIDAYFERYKGVRAWIDKTIDEARKTGRVQTLFGRIRPMPDIHSKEFNTRQFAERTAINTPIQGTAADLIKIAMIRVHNGLQEKHLSARILLQVHDELVLEAPEAEVGAASELVKREMENAATLRVPLKVDMNVADNWKDMK